MTDDIEAASERLRRASDDAPSEVREQLRSLAEGLDELAGGGATRATEPSPDRLEEVAEKLHRLQDEAADEETRTAVREATARVLAARNREE